MSERSGVVNIALEGIMLTGAFVGYGVAFLSHNLWLGLIAAVLAGMLIAAIHAVLAISFFVDQIVSGTVINILAIGITGVFYRTFLESQSVAGPGTLPVWHVPFLSDLPVVGQILFQNAFVTYAMLVLVLIVYLVIFHTTWGLRTRACGEHPQAAETAGINVYLVRYVNVVVSGALAGLGGAYFSLQQIGNFLPGMTGGRGEPLRRARCVNALHRLRPAGEPRHRLRRAHSRAVPRDVALPADDHRRRRRRGPSRCPRRGRQAIPQELANNRVVHRARSLVMLR